MGRFLIFFIVETHAGKAAKCYQKTVAHSADKTMKTALLRRFSCINPPAIRGQGYNRHVCPTESVNVPQLFCAPASLFMKTVVLTGPESSGKSVLAQALQHRFGGIVVGEYVRHFIDSHAGRDTCLADIPAIARGQLAWEDAARARQPKLLILDTHLLSNLLWSRTLFGECPAWIEEQLRGRDYDLHLVLSPRGMDWVDDGQRCQPALQDRLAFFDQVWHWLDTHHQCAEVLEGDYAQRSAQAFKRVGELLGEPPTVHS